MAIPEDFGPLLRALAQAEDDLKSNAPLPRPTAITMTDALAAIVSAQAKAEAVSNWLIAHPGVYWLARRVLTALAAMRVSWAPEALAALKALPGALAEATLWLPRLRGFLAAMQPAPWGGPPITQGQPWAGPQPVDNPSGEIGGPFTSQGR
jgi:hypothetical protein